MANTGTFNQQLVFFMFLSLMPSVLASVANVSLELESLVESRVIDVESRVESFRPNHLSQVEFFYHDSSLSNTSFPVFSFLWFFNNCNRFV